MRQKSTLLIGAALLIILVILMIFVSSKSTDDPQPRLLSSAEFISAYEGTPGAVLIDVRTPGEFDAGHLEGAVNIDIQSPSFISELRKLDATTPYFVYCRSGGRSAQAVAMMKTEGFENIYELASGISGNQSLPLVTGAQ